jgi:phosphatidylserine/phosphatidylglycerophosphate/cardiolipin synthase-like enzyme
MSLLADKGDSFKSIILDNALELLNNASQSIRFTSQFAPEGPVLNALHEAQQKGVDVQMIISKNGTHTSLSGLAEKASTVFMDFKNQEIPLLRSPKRLHAKLLLIDTEDETKRTALFGSHNLSSRGVMLGTAEAAIKTTNPQLVTNLTKFYTGLAQRSTADLL